MMQSPIKLSAPLRGVRVEPANPTAQDGLASTQQNGAKVDGLHDQNEATEATLLAALNQTFSCLVEEMREIEQRRRASLAEMQQATVELAAAIASQVVYDTIDSGEFPIAATVQRVVNELQDEPVVTVRLHPDDLALLQTQMKADENSWSAAAELHFQPDKSLARGDCRADASDFGIMYKLQRHLAELRRFVLDDMDDAQTERRENQGRPEAMRRFPDRRETA